MARRGPAGEGSYGTPHLIIVSLSREIAMHTIMIFLLRLLVIVIAVAIILGFVAVIFMGIANSDMYTYGKMFGK